MPLRTVEDQQMIMDRIANNIGLHLIKAVVQGRTTSLPKNHQSLLLLNFKFHS